MGCKATNYCSAECQKAHWASHKKTCTSTQKHNCFLIRAISGSTALSRDSIPDHVEPFPLKNYGTEAAEAAELRGRLGWTTAFESGNFYDHLGTNTWYYFVYGQMDGKSEGKPRNEIASQACGRDIWGDVAVVRSGPVGSKPPEKFSSGILCKTLQWLQDKDSGDIFAEREKQRAMRSMGFSDADAARVPHCAL